MTKPSIIKITLYHWDKCGYCIEYLNKKADQGWIEMRDNYKKTPSGNILEYKEVEQREMDPKYKDLISSFPTILIKNDGEEYKYTGERIIDSILKTVDNCVNKQEGEYKPLIERNISGGGRKKTKKSKKTKTLKSLIEHNILDDIKEYDYDMYNHNNVLSGGKNIKSLTKDLNIEDIEYSYTI
jgi:hypothetical protein